jgi:hypothetical protein
VVPQVVEGAGAVRISPARQTHHLVSKSDVDRMPPMAGV